MSDAFAVRGPLRLAAVDWPAATPLAMGFDALPQVEFLRASTYDLANALEAGALDAALVPPLAALRIPGVRLVPGIALTLREPLPEQLVWSDSGLAAVLQARASLDDLNRAWREHTQLPLVLLVWACRHRAPYPEIRKAVVQAARAGEAEAQALPGFGYLLGSEESDALRVLLKQGQARGLIALEQDVLYC